MRSKLITALAVAATLALGVGSVDAAQADTGSDELVVANLINAERAAHGLAPLRIDGALFDSARVWSQTMAAAGDLSHDASYFGTRPAGVRARGENVAYNATVAAAHQRLMDSPGHRANILDPSFTNVGVGIIERDGTLYITERFSAVQDAPAKVTKAKAAKGKAVRAKARRSRR